MTDRIVGEETVANRRLAAEVSMLESKLDQVSRINADLRADMARLRLSDGPVSDVGTGNQEGADGFTNVEDSNDSLHLQPHHVLDLEKTDPASIAAKEGDSVMKDVHSTGESTAIKNKKKVPPGYRSKGGKRHQKNRIPAGRSTPRKITLLTIVSDDSTRDMNTVLKTSDDNDKIATSTSKSTLTIVPNSPEVKRKQQPEAGPPEGSRKTTKISCNIAHRINILTDKELMEMKQAKSELDAALNKFKTKLRKISEPNFNKIILEWQPAEMDIDDQDVVGG